MDIFENNIRYPISGFVSVLKPRDPSIRGDYTVAIRLRYNSPIIAIGRNFILSTPLLKKCLARKFGKSPTSPLNNIKVT